MATTTVNSPPICPASLSGGIQRAAPPRWDAADMIAADDGVTFRRKAQLMNLRRQLDDLDRALRWAGR